MGGRAYRLHRAGREAFMGEVFKHVDEYGGNICSQLRRMGASTDWSRQVLPAQRSACDVLASYKTASEIWYYSQAAIDASKIVVASIRARYG